MKTLYLIGILLIAVALVGVGVTLKFPPDNQCDPGDPSCGPGRISIKEIKFCDPGDPSCGPGGGSGCTTPPNC